MTGENHLTSMTGKFLCRSSLRNPPSKTFLPMPSLQLVRRVTLSICLA
jgi:hypothetical protein